MTKVITATAWLIVIFRILVHIVVLVTGGEPFPEENLRPSGLSLLVSATQVGVTLLLLALLVMALPQHVARRLWRGGLFVCAAASLFALLWIMHEDNLGILRSLFVVVAWLSPIAAATLIVRSLRGECSKRG